MDRVQWCGNNSPRAGISPRFPGRFNSIRAASPPLDTRVVFLLLPYLIKLTEACPTGCLLARHYVVTWTLTSTFSCFQCYRLFQGTVSSDHKRFMTCVLVDTGSMISQNCSLCTAYVYGALCRVRLSQSLILHSAPYTYYQGLDIICSHISEQSTTTYFNPLF